MAVLKGMVHGATLVMEVTLVRNHSETEGTNKTGAFDNQKVFENFLPNITLGTCLRDKRQVVGPANMIVILVVAFGDPLLRQLHICKTIP